jgi:hypothetical protein
MSPRETCAAGVHVVYDDQPCRAVRLTKESGCRGSTDGRCPTTNWSNRFERSAGLVCLSPVSLLGIGGCLRAGGKLPAGKDAQGEQDQAGGGPGGGFGEAHGGERVWTR